MIETKKLNWWAIGVLIFFAVALIWCLSGVFSYLLGFQSAVAYADWSDPPPESNYYVNDLILAIQEESTEYWLDYDEYTIECENGNEFMFHQSMRFWDDELHEWDGGTGASIGVFPCLLDSGKWWYKGWYASAVNLSLYKSYLTTNGEGYYRLTMNAGSNGYVQGDPYALVHWDGVELLLVEDYIPPPPIPRVWGIGPASETEITNLATTFEFGWEDLDDWDTLTIVFKNRDTGILMEAQELLITTSPSGSTTFNFSDFNPDRNGIFHFFAVAGRSVMETIQGMFITGRWTYEWSYDLVDPEYWLDFNIVGLTPVFEMSDFEGWYGDVSKFATPSDMAVAIAGFFEPIFQKLGEFGNRISDYFNVNEAYAQGYEIGKNIPYFTYFLDQLNVFFGGFPVMKWLFVLILLLVGIFIFRLIMKFIPFLGN